jgi:hypothetical protein
MVNKDEIANIVGEGLEAEPPLETMAMVGAPGFSIFPGLVLNLSGLELAEQLIHGESLIVGRLNDRRDLHLPNPLIQSMK